MAYETKVSYLLKKMIKNPGKWKKLPSSKIILKTDYAKVQGEAQKKRKSKKGNTKSIAEVPQTIAKKKKIVDETFSISKKKVIKPKIVKPKVAMDPLTKKFLQRENKAEQLKLRDLPKESREWSAEALQTIDQPPVEKSPAKESNRDERTTRGNEPSENVPTEVTSAEEGIAKKSAVEIENSVEKKTAEKITAEDDKSAEKVMAAEESSAEELVTIVQLRLSKKLKRW